MGEYPLMQNALLYEKKVPQEWNFNERRNWLTINKQNEKKHSLIIIGALRIDR